MRKVTFTLICDNCGKKAIKFSPPPNPDDICEGWFYWGNSTKYYDFCSKECVKKFVPEECKRYYSTKFIKESAQIAIKDILNPPKSSGVLTT